ncbi:MAG: hypothetical protein HQK53_05950 [Oligoflexia bacterium]|nr:hypothetical protein [Oligoflexia bacterium]
MNAKMNISKILNKVMIFFVTVFMPLHLLSAEVLSDEVLIDDVLTLNEFNMSPQDLLEDYEMGDEKSRFAILSFQRSSRRLGQEVRKEIESMDNSLAAIDKSIDHNIERWYFNTVRVMLGFSVEIGIVFLSFKIVPTVELEWTRQNPAGWSSYVPGA